MLAPRVKILALLATFILVIATPAQAVGVGCRAAEGAGDDGRPAQHAECQAAGTRAGVPAQATPTVVLAMTSTYGALVAAGLCPAEGECSFGNPGGPSAEFSSTNRNGTHELKGHVTLIR